MGRVVAACDRMLVELPNATHGRYIYDADLGVTCKEGDRNYAILNSYPKYVTVARLPADSDAQRLDIARACVSLRRSQISSLTTERKLIAPPSPLQLIPRALV